MLGKLFAGQKEDRDIVFQIFEKRVLVFYVMGFYILCAGSRDFCFVSHISTRDALMQIVSRGVSARDQNWRREPYEGFV